MNKTLNSSKIKTIQNFWNWFQDNQQAIYKAFVLNLNTEEVNFHLNRNCSYISKRIIFIPFIQEEKLNIIFSANGNQKLFPKILALEEHAPKLTNISPLFFIKPITNKEMYLNKKDDFLTIYNQKIKISDLYLQLENYNTSTKKIAISIFHTYKNSEEMAQAIHFVTKLVIGEIAFKKHLKKLEIKQCTKIPNGLLPLVELDEFIKHLNACMVYKKSEI